MESIAVLAVLTLLSVLVWLRYYSGLRILDAFSAVKSEYGTVVTKEYIPSHSEIITRSVTHTHDNGFSPTRYETPDEIQIAEEHLLHINLNGRFIVTSVADKLYDSVSQGDRVFVKYSQGRFSKKIYIKAIRHSQSHIAISTDL